MLKRIFKYAFLSIIVIIGLSLFWFRFILSEYDEFKNATIFEHRQAISTDGPYILYEKDALRYITVIENDGDFEIDDQDKASIDGSKGFTVNAYNYDKTTAISFEVELMDSLTIPKSEYPKPEKLLAVSDIEGNFYAFHKLLKANSVIDDQCNWIFGDGHLVLIGDFVDRGLNVSQCLWLIYKLEQQAHKHEGAVHFILGNHELLNLNGRNFHVRSKYTNLAEAVGLDYSLDFYGPNSELGRWLRTKNTIEKIGDNIYVHGGISQKLIDTQLSIEHINQIVRDHIGSLDYKDSFSELIHSSDGPLSYRGQGHDQGPNTAQLIENIKAYFGVSGIVIGHSTVKDIYPQYQHSLFNVDVHFPHHDEDVDRGKGMLIETDKKYKVDDMGRKTLL